jgi:surface antigen
MRPIARSEQWHSPAKTVAIAAVAVAVITPCLMSGATDAAAATGRLAVVLRPKVVQPGGVVKVTIRRARGRGCRLTSNRRGVLSGRLHRTVSRFKIPAGARSGRVRVAVRCGRRVAHATLTISRRPDSEGRPPTVPSPQVGPGSQDILADQWVDCSIGCGGSQGNPFPYGQCTYHAYETRPDIYDYATTHGQPRAGWNGYQWSLKAAAVGYVVGATPTRGSLAVFSREYFGGPNYDNAGGQYGHVGYVESVNTDGSFVMSERNWSGNPNVTTHTYRPRAGIQFVHGLASGQSPAPQTPYPSNPGSRDLFFAKTRNTGSGHVELHSATPGSGFQSGQHSVTWFSPGDADNGWFQEVGADLFLVKTKHPGSGHVEVHSATASSGYQSAGQHSVTWFSPGDADNGWFQMVGRDLYFIKTRNTGSGHVEVHSATAASGYQSGQHIVTWFSPGDANNGWFQMAGQDLFFVKTKNTGSGRVEVHSATLASGYGSGEHTVTWLSPSDANNGWFQVAGTKG